MRWIETGKRYFIDFFGLWGCRPRPGSRSARFAGHPFATVGVHLQDCEMP